MDNINTNQNAELQAGTKDSMKQKKQKVDKKIKQMEDQNPMTISTNQMKWQNEQLQEDHDYLVKHIDKLKVDLFSGKDSELMKNVKDSLDPLVKFFNQPISIVDSKNLIKISEIADSRYTDVIYHAQKYINAKTPHGYYGKRRLRWVTNIQEKCKREQGAFRVAVERIRKENLLDNKEVMKEGKISDILFYARALHANINKDNKMKKMTVGDVSSVYSLKYEENKEGVFKVREQPFVLTRANVLEVRKKIEKTMKSGDAKFYRNIFEYMDEIDNYMKEHLYDKLLNKGDEISPEDKMKLEKADHDMAMLYIHVLVSDKSESLQRELDHFAEKAGEILKDMNIKKGFPKYGDNEFADLEDKYEINDILDKDYFKEFYSIAVTNTNQIHLDAVLAYRNTATSRMADMFHMPQGSIVKCENCILETQEKKKKSLMSGIMMEKAKGMSLGALSDEYGLRGEKSNYKRTISPEARKQLIRIQLLDQICGQTDRHIENIFAQYEVDDEKKSITITGFTGIDNDMSFGNITKDMLENGFNRMASLYHIDSNDKAILKYKKIDQETYDNLMGLNMEDIRYQLADCGISKEEFDAMEKRLTTLQNAFEEEKNKKDSKFILDETTDKDMSLVDMYDVSDALFTDIFSLVHALRKCGFE